VADTSLRFDHDSKIPLYVRYGIPEVWLVDLKAKRLVRYRNPQQGAYALVDVPDLDTSLAIETLPGLAVELGSLFG
jgi:Uma2 family endonuclease